MKATTRQPQVVLMDLEMPKMDGIETIQIASSAFPETRFIVLTIFEDNGKIFEAIKAGACGYLLKEDSATNIVDAITNVVEYNGIPMSPAIARKTIDLLRQLPSQSDTNISESHQLSEREMEILRELVSGKDYRTIGEKLFISKLTVRKHVSNIYDKLHVNSRAQVIHLAHKKKWI
jgi:DNA-binding NarL/FixJ family response regulator